MLRLLRPHRYAADSARGIVLKGGKCACGYVSFPRAVGNCPGCNNHARGGTPWDISAAGTLVACSELEVHRSETFSGCFVVATIKLDDGPIIRSVVNEKLDAVPLGARMVGSLVPAAVTQEGWPVFDLRFRHLDIAWIEVGIAMLRTASSKKMRPR